MSPAGTARTDSHPIANMVPRHHAKLDVTFGIHLCASVLFVTDVNNHKLTHDSREPSHSAQQRPMPMSPAQLVPGKTAKGKTTAWSQLWVPSAALLGIYLRIYLPTYKKKPCLI